MYRKTKVLFGLIMGLIISFLLIQPSLANSEVILEKQAEIDQYLFVDHLDELEEMGIHVTHTSPTDTHVEIGISPYSDEHAEYLTEIFGAEFVQVVEGQEAVTLTTGADTVSPEMAVSNEVEETSGSSSATVWWFTGIGAVLLAAVLYIVVRRNKQTVS